MSSVWLETFPEAIFTGIENIWCYSCGEESTVYIRHIDRGEREGRGLTGDHQANERGFQGTGSEQQTLSCIGNAAGESHGLHESHWGNLQRQTKRLPPAHTLYFRGSSVLLWRKTRVLSHPWGLAGNVAERNEAGLWATSERKSYKEHHSKSRGGGCKVSCQGWWSFEGEGQRKSSASADPTQTRHTQLSIYHLWRGFPRV